MSITLTLPRLIFGEGKLKELEGELELLGVKHALLISDRGLERAGIVEAVTGAASAITALFLDVPENPTAEGADAAAQAFIANRCDSIVALGGGSVLDTAKLVAALINSEVNEARMLIGRPELINEQVVPLLAIPTTVGTGSESSPVAALHMSANGPAIGTRSFRLVPRTALCDPNLTTSLPPRLIAATAVDALSHCIEGFFAEPAHPLIDALALDGIQRVLQDTLMALEPGGKAARASLMAAAFAGGAAIHKGLGPAHAVALACGDQDVHHGTIIGVALPYTTVLLARHLPDKAARIMAVLPVGAEHELGRVLHSFVESLHLPRTLIEAGYSLRNSEKILIDIVNSPFNRTTPYVPSHEEYQEIITAISE